MTITGTLVADAKVITPSGKKPFVAFRIAVNNAFKNEEGVATQPATFLSCRYYKDAKVASYMKKADNVEIHGDITFKVWVDAQGTPRGEIDIFVKDCKFFGTARRNPGTMAQESVPAESVPAETLETEDLPF
ncbi:single-stranded DNA-binding protein [Chitinophaga sancti]|uniref:Single-stranded DNA-binding protein n=1 Tax=Chitinophaga sancti TaxID=1004 RepID=A0A1K1SZQ3_9BACT|nr:single-stranded DNA-binding protein [Chitinophaga sancti]WQD65389.1 single-stranded DNA-binding protein [Chitinophaga sancti]WQG88987.1 single-stranded DNA-binding protein [Chitinophaga sancti]SFW89779.1 Single-strand binding protein family protein [Chitinophaga sancti]